MRELEQWWPAARGLIVGALTALLAAACSQAPKPQPVKIKDTPTPAEATVAAPEPSPTQPAAPDQGSTAAPAPAPASPDSSSLPTQPSSSSAAQSPPDPDPTLVVIDPGGPGPDEDIVAAARAERERRAKAPPASKSITNKNLVKESQPARKASDKSAAKPGAGKLATKPAAAGEAGSAVRNGKDEAYWRGRSRELRELWKEAADQIADLERDADGLRRRFYAESDPYVRDTRVKPDWDRVLDRIREMQAEAERRRQELREHLEEGRRAGALPGWLREGIELEPPAPRDNPEAGEHQAVEPPVYTEAPLEPPPRLLSTLR